MARELRARAGCEASQRSCPGIVVREDLTNDGRFVEDGVRGKMRFPRSTTALWAMSALAILAGASTNAQSNSAPEEKPPAAKSDQTSRLTIEVSGGESETPVENASIYVKYVEERKILKDKKLELNIKTNKDGKEHVQRAPMGRVWGR